jgi:hypothetical protein
MRSLSTTALVVKDQRYHPRPFMTRGPPVVAGMASLLAVRALPGDRPRSVRSPGDRGILNGWTSGSARLAG